jgi:hypothetical protein
LLKNPSTDQKLDLGFPAHQTSFLIKLSFFKAQKTTRNGEKQTFRVPNDSASPLSFRNSKKIPNILFITLKNENAIHLSEEISNFFFSFLLYLAAVPFLKIF